MTFDPTKVVVQRVWFCPVNECWQGYECGDNEHGDEDDAHECDEDAPDELFNALPAADYAALLAERNAAVARAEELKEALRCEEAYSHAKSSNEWMGTLKDAGWDGKSNPRPFINKLRRAALSRMGGGA